VHERERWQVIKAMLKQQLLVRIADVCRATGASEASVRRDFSRLAEMGSATRVRGGLEAMPGSQMASSQMASSDAPALATRSFEISKTLNVAAKRAIARTAVALCSDGDAIIINGGTTTFEMGEFLRERRLKVLTNSYPLAETLIHHSNCRVALPGGEVYREQKLIVSPFDEDAIQHYSASRMFMSAISIGPLGVIEGDPLIARAETKLLKRAEKLVVLADSSKFTPRGSLVVCPLSRISTLITDVHAPKEALDMLRDAGVEVMIATDAPVEVAAA
jgi:DeoR family ulaG and ulaABCDEF operon transcriptional repressor